MTNHWIDLKNADVILIMGSNAAENHPISFKWVTEAQKNGATLINVDPRFTRTSSKADIYTSLRSGTDIAFLGGMIKYILDNQLYHEEYMLNYTNAAFIVGQGFGFKDGLFTGYDERSAATTTPNGPSNSTTRACPRRIRPSRIPAACSTCSRRTTSATPQSWFPP